VAGAIATDGAGTALVVKAVEVTMVGQAACPITRTVGGHPAAAVVDTTAMQLESIRLHAAGQPSLWLRGRSRLILEAHVPTLAIPRLRIAAVVQRMAEGERRVVAAVDIKAAANIGRS